ncbi:MAG TPA: cellulose binding domain-containing protein [Jiangellaceae bacterium]|nr:cellulose binding domain-containing protein [Jiangellaceae bacterium]
MGALSLDAEGIADQAIKNGWNAAYEQDGRTVTAANLKWNQTLKEGQRVTIGFVGHDSGSTDHVPEMFFLNGTRCTS